MREVGCDAIRPAAQAVAAGRLRVADTFGERVPECYVSAEQNHGINIADWGGVRPAESRDVTSGIAQMGRSATKKLILRDVGDAAFWHLEPKGTTR